MIAFVGLLVSLLACGVTATSVAKRDGLTAEQLQMIHELAGHFTKVEDGVMIHHGPSAEEIATALLDKFDFISGDAIGCRDGTVEGYFPISGFVQACAGKWTGLLGSASDQLCSVGWHACSPAKNKFDARLLKTIEFAEGRAVDGCFAYDASNDFGKCIPLNCDGRDENDMGAVGSKCNLKSSQTSCLASGRIDLKNRACGFFEKGVTDGFLCCKDI